MTEPFTKLKHLKPFSSGGNRLCYVSPDSENMCLKVHQSHRTPTLRRRERKDLRRLYSLSYFDENIQEDAAIRYFEKKFRGPINEHFPQTYGLVDTDLGRALSVELIRDHDRQVSLTIEQYLWHNGLDEHLKTTLGVFQKNWIEAGIRTRELLPHNLLIQQNKVDSRIVIIDGFGRPHSFSILPKKQTGIAKKRISQLHKRIQIVLQRKADGEAPNSRITRLRRVSS